jgi:hypothetical protein
VGGSGPFIHGKEVESLDFGKRGEESHYELTSCEIATRSEEKPQDLAGGHITEA